METCHRLRDRLRAAGFDVWIDADDVCKSRPGLLAVSRQIVVIQYARHRLVPADLVNPVYSSSGYKDPNVNM